MAIESTFGQSVAGFISNAEAAIGDAIFLYFGIMVNSATETAIFYGLMVFTVFVLWQILKPAGGNLYDYKMHR